MFNGDRMLPYHARQYLIAQQALFNSIYLYTLIKDDCDLERWPEEQQFITNYYKTNRVSASDLMDRLIITKIISYKMTAGTQIWAQLNRIKASEFMAKQRYEKPGEVQTLFTQLMYNYITKRGF